MNITSLKNKAGCYLIQREQRPNAYEIGKLENIKDTLSIVNIKIHVIKLVLQIQDKMVIYVNYIVNKVINILIMLKQNVLIPFQMDLIVMILLRIP